jgi:hypothetical protein
MVGSLSNPDLTVSNTCHRLGHAGNPNYTSLYPIEYLTLHLLSPCNIGQDKNPKYTSFASMNAYHYTHSL